MSTRALLTPVLTAAALGLAACGGASADHSGGRAAPATGTTTTTPAPSGNQATRIAAQVSKDLRTRPAVPPPTTEPPTTLQKADAVKGKGAVVRKGDRVTVQYVGVSWSTGREFDASWNAGRPFPFRVGAGKVIPGWDQGVPGMRVGGRRVLVIPPQLGYGEQGQPPTIVPNETLVFVIDAVKVRR